MTGATEIPLPDRIAEVERELASRKRRWPKDVALGHFDATTASLRTRRLEAALATLKALRADPLVGTLDARGVPTWPNR